MRSLLLLCSIFISTMALSQRAKRYTFPKVGWTLQVPPDFVVSDSSGSVAYMNEAVNLLKDVNNTQVDATQTSVLIVADKNDNNFNAIITPYHPRIDGSYTEHLKRMHTMAYTSLKDALPHAHIDTVKNKALIDTASSKITIDGVVFERFVATIKINGKAVSTVVALSKLYKGYDFGITYSYYDEQVKEQMEAMLMRSTFKK